MNTLTVAVSTLILFFGSLSATAETLLDVPNGFVVKLNTATGSVRQELIGEAKAYKPDSALLAEIRKSVVGSLPEETAVALETVFHWGPQAAPLAADIAAAIEHKNEEIAAYSACTLAYVDPEFKNADSSVAKLLRRILSGSKGSLQLGWCVISLVAFKIDPKNVPEFIAILSEIKKDPKFRGSEPLAFVFAKLGSPVVEHLRGCLKNGPVWERRSSLYALTFMGPAGQAALPEVVTFLDSEDTNVRFPAVAAAVAMKSDDALVQARIETILTRATKSAKDLSFMESEDRDAMLLGLRCGGAASVPLISKALTISTLVESSKQRLRAWLPPAVDSLMPVLVANVNSGIPQARENALLILSKMEGAAKPALPVLEAALLKNPADAALKDIVKTIRSAKASDPFAKLKSQ